jgi:hypothetical protein
MPILKSLNFRVGFSLLGLIFLTNCTAVKLPLLASERKPGEAPRYLEFKHVQPIFNSRCVVCHSCLESPCQVNMQSWEGLRRGAYHKNVYDGLRIDAVAPTRLYEDAQTEQQWRAKGFVDILNGGDDSLLISALRLTALRTSPPKTPARDSMICYQERKRVKTSGDNVAETSMPYGLPPLSAGENDVISDWVASGAPGPAALPLSTNSLPKNLKNQVKSWEAYLNQSDLNSKLVSRYLYEHLFLAHLYFKESPRDFLKLVRSSTACAAGVTPIATRRPTDDPGPAPWFYCFYKDPAVIVYKNHLPYELSTQKLSWIKKNFSSPSWKASKMPSYSAETAANPLLAFEDIPVISRHRFLLENAEYEVMTFIKGPVCNGSFAVNVIQEQFFVFFTQPETDLMVLDTEYGNLVKHEELLPGGLGTNPGTSKILTGYYDILKHRSGARLLKAQHLQKTFPQGMGLGNIWNGDGNNSNAILTVFRHLDNAKVVKGAKGDLSKTIFVLDYSVFERLVYNLVINFDVFDNVTHQTLTRLYMDLLRMDAEDNFLQFLPSAERLKLKESWYKGWLTEWKLDLLDENKFAKIPAKIKFAPGIDTKKQMVEKILFERMNKKVRGENDGVNWRALNADKKLNSLETELRKIASLSKERDKVEFSQFFDHLSVLIVREQDDTYKTYSIIHNQEHTNVSWILNEDGRMAASEDTLTLLPGVLGAYPNEIFYVDRKDVSTMVEEILLIRSGKHYESFIAKYGVNRMDPKMWMASDLLHSELSRLQPIEAGILDLSRYSLR